MQKKIAQGSRFDHAVEAESEASHVRLPVLELQDNLELHTVVMAHGPSMPPHCSNFSRLDSLRTQGSLASDSITRRPS